MKTIIKWTLNSLVVVGAVALAREYKIRKSVHSGVEDLEKTANGMDSKSQN